MKQRKSYSAEVKAKIAVEAIKGQRTVQEIGVAQWKRHAVERLAQVFQDGRSRDDRADEELKAELYQQIGQLQVELLCRDRHNSSNAESRIMPGRSGR